MAPSITVNCPTLRPAGSAVTPGALRARTKDGLENELHWRVCSGQMQLRDAQNVIATNWIAGTVTVCNSRPLRELIADFTE